MKLARSSGVFDSGRARLRRASRTLPVESRAIQNPASSLNLVSESAAAVLAASGRYSALLRKRMRFARPAQAF